MSEKIDLSELLLRPRPRALLYPPMPPSPQDRVQGELVRLVCKALAVAEANGGEVQRALSICEILRDRLMETGVRIREAVELLDRGYPDLAADRLMATAEIIEREVGGAERIKRN